MSDAVILNLSNMADSFSAEELAEAISMLSQKLKNLFASHRAEKQIEEKKESEPAFLTELFAMADCESEKHKSEGKWTRDELYRY